jgi:predicted secreted Zn-dependent protease
MFEQVFESLRTATEANMQLQQELFKKWVGMFPGVPAAGAEPFPKLQKKWVEFVAGLAKKQRETMEAQFSAGLKNIEEAFRIAEVKDPEEVRTKTIELWQKSFEFIRQAYEAQMRDFQAAAVKWTELMTKGAAA